ncbi:sphingomyelin phosphodiesterase [Staphylococcus massiliensis]|uniref:sphingomyelin phosphodiesterase n=1 Tax=Staphylococcus massiliensis TaxID=555791 RepID=UPI001EDE625F|nr:sphingomyelin phosphodiesterase [Staphylococcus massiliensis]MCG3399237.1 sphingomyelin phosphodiesterase [Staphylococcus massiliensis]
MKTYIKKAVVGIMALSMAASISISEAKAETSPETSQNVDVLTHNVYFMPHSLYPNWGQVQRAKLIPEADYFQGHDIVILNELFEEDASKVLFKEMEDTYPNHTPVLGRSKQGWDQTTGNYRAAAIEDGGVSIASKWPIKKQEQHFYKNGCGVDGAANKGFVYVEILKNNKPVHVIGTHMQSEDGACVKGKDKDIRETQMAEIRNFIKEKEIPKDEPVIIGGDLNVNKGTEEYQNMFANLNASKPDAFDGWHKTWDTKTNSIAKYNYPEWPPEYLDYILLDKDHAQPKNWTNTAIKAKSPTWTVKSWGKSYSYNDYSDHYPIQAGE